MQENIFTPEFIPYYIKEIQEHKLTPTEWLLYGFIRFYNSLKNQGFYFQSEQLAQIIGTTAGMIDKSLAQLDKKWLIIRETTRYVGWSKRIIKLATWLNSRVAPDYIVGNTWLNSQIKEEYINNNKLLLLHNNKAQALDKPREVSIDSLYYDPTQDTEQDQNTEQQERQERQEYNPTPYPLPAEVVPEVVVEKRGNPLVSAIIQAITDYHGWVDGSMVQERRYAKNLAGKIMKHPTWSEFRNRTESDDEAMYQFIRTLCESATKYQLQWTTSPKWLFYNYIKIISNKPNCSVWILS